MYFPLASPMQYTCGTTSPLVSSTCIFSLTGTKPRRSVSEWMADRFSPVVKGALQYAGEETENGDLGSGNDWGHAANGGQEDTLINEGGQH